MVRSLEEKRNSLRSKLADLIENGPADQETEGYEAQFAHLGITQGEQQYLAGLLSHPGLGVLMKIFKLRAEVIENALKYDTGGSSEYKLELLHVWQAFSMALEDMENFPKMAQTTNPTQIEEDEEGFLA